MTRDMIYLSGRVYQWQWLLSSHTRQPLSFAYAI